MRFGWKCLCKWLSKNDGKSDQNTSEIIKRKMVHNNGNESQEGRRIQSYSHCWTSNG